MSFIAHVIHCLCYLGNHGRSKVTHAFSGKNSTDININNQITMNYEPYLSSSILQNFILI
jgi:hypothetical protein